MIVSRTHIKLTTKFQDPTVPKSSEMALERKKERKRERKEGREGGRKEINKGRKKEREEFLSWHRGNESD